MVNYCMDFFWMTVLPCRRTPSPQQLLQLQLGSSTRTDRLAANSLSMAQLSDCLGLLSFQGLSSQNCRALRGYA